MSESLRNDGRIWVPKRADDKRPANEIPEEDRDYYLERIYPAFGNLVPRDVASRVAKRMVDSGKGVGPLENGVYLDFKQAIERDGQAAIQGRYSNLFEMYERITDENPYQVPMRIYPAPHYTMGGLWVDYNLMTTIPGLYSLGEANFSDHGANRLGASALMQGLADGYFVLPYTIGDDLAPRLGDRPVPTDDPVFRDAERVVHEQVRALLAVRGTSSVDHYHRELGKILWDNCGMSRSEQSLTKALAEIPALRAEFHENVRVLGEGESRNQSLEKAGRVADYLEFAELLCTDALHRNESCGGHFREEHQTADGEALRDDEGFAYVAAWEWAGTGRPPVLHREPLTFEAAAPSTRSYK
jgi:succinate dehydrogenase / fumarate reductase flavoprotein subunit